MSSQENLPVPTSRQVAKAPSERADVVIIGNGIAGLTAAIETRRLAPDKHIVIVTNQIHPTINTPALKQFAVAKLTQEQLLAYPAGTERAERIHVLTAHIERIHAEEQYIEARGGRCFGYESLLIASGSTPNGLPNTIPGHDFDGVMILHRLQDYLDLRRRLGDVREAVVIGGGVHANETVMGLLHWGIQVHWLIRSDTFMPRQLDAVSSEMILEGARRAGANVYTQTEVVGVVGRVGSVAGVVTNHQELLPCQLVLSCTGTRAATKLAEQCDLPLRHKKGILVDDQLRTSVRNIYAAGDVAALKNPYTGSYETRAQWYAAVSQGRTVAAMIAGHDELARKPFGVPWHATHLGEHYMLSVGDPMTQGGNVMTMTDTSQGGYRRLAIVDNRLVGYLSLGSKQPDSLAIKRLVDEGYEANGIIRELLKGDLDVRAYLAQRRSRNAQGILTGNRPVQASTTTVLSAPPVPTPFQSLPSPTRSVDETVQAGSASRQPEKVRETDALRTISPVRSNALYEEEQISPFTGTLPNLANTDAEEEEISPFTGTLPDFANTDAEEEEISPFTGTLPDLAEEAVEEEAFSPFTGNLPNLPVEAMWEEEISPFTGNLPSLGGSSARYDSDVTVFTGLEEPIRIVESTLAPANRQEGGASSSNLWSYQTNKTSKARQNGKKREQQTPGSLWSYTSRARR